MLDTERLKLDDGQVVDAALLSHFPPVSPSKVIAVHIPYLSRSMETRSTPKPTPPPW